MKRTFTAFIIHLIFFTISSVVSAKSNFQRAASVLPAQDIIRFVFTPKKLDIDIINQYIKERHQVMDGLAFEKPEETVYAYVSYNRYLSSSELAEVIKYYGTNVIALNIGWKEQRGEYKLKTDESITEALKNAMTQHGIFVQELYQSAFDEYQENMSLGINKVEQQRLSNFFTHAADLKDTFEKYGVLYYGLVIKDKASKLKIIKDTDSNIRLLDPLWDKRETKLNLSGIYTKKIGIPILPDYLNN